MATTPAAEKVIALENELAAVKQQLADKIESLSQAVATGASRQEALAREETAHAKTKQALADAQGEVAAAGTVIGELNNELSQAQEKAAAGAGKPSTVKYNGITYEVAIPRFRVAGSTKVHTADDVTEGSALLAQLVASGSGVLVAIDAPVE